MFPIFLILSTVYLDTTVRGQKTLKFADSVLGCKTWELLSGIASLKLKAKYTLPRW